VTDTSIPIPPALFPFVFIAAWVAVTGMVSFLGGWSQLARQYRTPAAVRLDLDLTYRLRSLQLRRLALMPATYSGCVTVGFAPAGLYLAPLFVFRLFHPPLLIPWGAISSLDEGSFLWSRWANITLRDGGPTIRLYGSSVDTASGYWGKYRNAPRIPMPAA
jgi:hypothetical protein